MDESVLRLELEGQERRKRKKKFEEGNEKLYHKNSHLSFDENVTGRDVLLGTLNKHYLRDARFYHASLTHRSLDHEVPL